MEVQTKQHFRGSRHGGLLRDDEPHLPLVLEKQANLGVYLSTRRRLSKPTDQRFAMPWPKFHYNLSSNWRASHHTYICRYVQCLSSTTIVYALSSIVRSILLTQLSLGRRFSFVWHVRFFTSRLRSICSVVGRCRVIWVSCGGTSCNWSILDKKSPLYIAIGVSKKTPP